MSGTDVQASGTRGSEGLVLMAELVEQEEVRVGY